tara:strand:+ start:1092 stop:1376 length:285 start_codon:yes stop_codon:yes gene_type:complete
MIDAEIYGITPRAKIDILDKEPPENILNMSRMLPLCCSKRKLITAGSMPGRVMKLPNLNTINAKITKNILCLSSEDFVRPPRLDDILLAALDII